MVAAAFQPLFRSGRAGADPHIAWEQWLLRAALLVTGAVQFAARNTGGGLVALEGLVWTFLPFLVEWLGHTHVPRAVSRTFIAIVALQFVSESMKLFEIFYYWDKILHPLEVALGTLIFAWLFLGYVDTYRLRLSRPCVGALAMLLGAAFGTLWEFVEFTGDWFGNADLQKSNADTMTDIFSNDVGAYLATIAALWLYHRAIEAEGRRALGEFARWLTRGPGHLFERHGKLAGSVATAILALAAFAFWFFGRQTAPPLPPGPPIAAPRSWSFTSTGLDHDVSVLDGYWQPDPRGVCRLNPEHPRPGSEKPGLVSLAPGSLLGNAGGFVARAHYIEQRPPPGTGSQMTAGIAFGIRDKDTFYVLESSSLHDVVRLDRYVRGTRRDVREEHAVTRGDEWHDLEVRVAGDRVTAVLDGRPLFTQTRVPDTAGGLGLWARATNAACFATASVEPLPSGTTA